MRMRKAAGMAIIVDCLLWLFATPADAQNRCRYYLVSHSDDPCASDVPAAKCPRGVTLSLEADADSKGVCALASANLVLAVADGKRYFAVSPAAAPSWQIGVAYTATAVLTGAGPQQLLLNGKSLGTTSTRFEPAQAAFFASLPADTGAPTEAYVLRQISLQASNGSDTLSLAPNSNQPIPMASFLMSGPAPWQEPFTEDPAQITTITATFRFDSIPPTPLQLAPYFDTFGQPAFSSWPGKVAVDGDLQDAVAEEQNWLANNGPLPGLDMYGGSTLAGWTDTTSNYFHTAYNNQRWWLVSPMGNPLFYIGLTGVFNNVTPITARDSIFSRPPPRTPDFAAAYSQDAWGDTHPTTYLSFDVANQIRKYGSGWQETSKSLAVQRILSWGFAGVGKEGGLNGLPRSPILKHEDVANVVPGGHPDVWDSAVLQQLSDSLSAQILPDAANPYILGWSVGNEKKEIVGVSEVKAILLKGASVPAKRALIDFGLTLYSGSPGKLGSAWGDPAATSAADLYAAKLTPTDKDAEKVRLFYEDAYYSTLYQTVKSIDSNHLYFGSWILAGDLVDLPIAAAHCDVVGIDDFSPTLSSDLLTAVAQANKPVLIGAFSFPSDYGGMRGFGWANYTQSTMYSDADAGEAYAQKVLSAGANPYFIGVEWFEYRDEPASGRGNTDGTPYDPNSLVVGENLAFGLVDVTDRPKYDLVNQVRSANIALLQSLGLQ